MQINVLWSLDFNMIDSMIEEMKFPICMLSLASRLCYCIQKEEEKRRVAMRVLTQKYFKKFTSSEQYWKLYKQVSNKE